MRVLPPMHLGPIQSTECAAMFCAWMARFNRPAAKNSTPFWILATTTAVIISWSRINQHFLCFRFFRRPSGRLFVSCGPTPDGTGFVESLFHQITSLAPLFDSRPIPMDPICPQPFFLDIARLVGSNQSHNHQNNSGVRGGCGKSAFSHS